MRRISYCTYFLFQFCSNFIDRYLYCSVSRKRYHSKHWNTLWMTLQSLDQKPAIQISGLSKHWLILTNIAKSYKITSFKCYGWTGNANPVLKNDSTITFFELPIRRPFVLLTQQNITKMFNYMIIVRKIDSDVNLVILNNLSYCFKLIQLLYRYN